ncbi:formin-binding protein [Coemansia nantahalensis]|nr:formin-binding protein [Coemansia nantahalensis]
MLVPAQQQQQPVQGHMGDMGGGYVVQGVAHMGSPLLRTGTYNGPAHTGNFGTLTGTAHMQQPFAGGGSSPHHPQQQQPQPQQHGGSAPSSPYIQAMGAARPGSAAGMHQRSPSAMQGHPMAAGRPVSAMQGGGPGPYAVPPAAAPPGYRAATPVQQQQQQHSPQYITRPPTQMAAAPSPRMHARAPSQMGAYGHPPMPQQQQQQQQIPPRSVSRVEPPGRSVTESGKEILFYVKVLYDYDADNDKELSIREGDVISVLAVSADGWWEGEMTDRRTGRPLHGTFPSNFTDPIANLIS